MSSRIVRSLLTAAVMLTLSRSSLVADASVALSNFTQTPGTNLVENGLPVAVKITATPGGDAVIGNVNLIYRTLATGAQAWWNTNAMTALGGGVYSGLVSRLPAGSVEYYVDCHFTGTAAVSPASSVVSNYTVSAVLNSYRFDTIENGAPAASYWVAVSGTTSNEWKRQVSGSADSTRWYASWAAVRTEWANLYPAGSAAPFLYLRDFQGAYWRTPYLAEGVGQIDFVSRLRYDDKTATIDVQVTTNATPTGWQTVQSLNYPLGGPTITGPITLNDPKVRYVRFMRTDATGSDATSYSTEAVGFDNIAISHPEAAVTMTLPANPIDPVVPKSSDVVTGRVDIANVDATTAAINRRVKLFYQVDGGAWASVAALHETNTTYRGLIPGFDTGTVNYYYQCDFDGYSYPTNKPLSAFQPSGAPTVTNSYTINFEPTRIITLAGESALAFGLVATNITETLTLTVGNSGNSDLTVTNILLPANFSVDVSEFVLPAGGSTNLNVTFAPTAVQLYGGNIVVESDKTAGTDTIAVTGEGRAAETITTPTVSGPTAATRGVAGTYGASASSNYGDPLQYRFAWGDGNTSAWAVASHAWGNTGVYHVTAQAQCTLHPTVVSPWSAPYSVTVTNTRVMRLVGNLSFSPPAVDIGAAPTRTLTVWNDGSDTLLVTNILIAPAAGFSANPTSFSVAAGGSSNVTVTFTPTAAVAYASTLTLLSDMTTGSNTVAVTGTGTDVETVNLLTLTGPTAGALGETLSYTITATNNRGNALQYRFDWGDGSGLTSWASGNSGTHAWSPYGIYAVRGQARSAVDTAVTSLWSSAISLHILAPPAITLTSTNSGLPIPVKVVVPPTNGTVTACTFYYRAPGTAGSSFEGLALTASSTNWVGALAPMNGGVMTYYVVYALSGVGDVRYPAAPGTLSHTIPSGLTSVGELRYADFTGWSSEADSAWTPGATTTYTNWSKSVVGGQKWLASGARVGAAQGPADPTGYSGNVLGLRSMQGAYLLSPSFEGGVGSVYFTASMKYTDQAAELAIQVSTNATPAAGDWETVGTLSFPATTPVLQRATPIQVGRPDAKRVRFLRTDAGTTDSDPYRMLGAIEIDNVAISIPPADLGIDERLRNPGYPSHDQDVKMRCRLVNSNANALAVNRQVTVWYQWGGTDSAGWTNSVAMSLAPALGADVYEGTIPMQPAGTLYYYYRCDFDGYYYQLAANGSTTNSEQRSPSFLPTSSSTTRPENFLSYEVRQYRSDIDLLEVRADTVQGSVVRGDYQMVLIDDYVWQGVGLIKGLTNMTWRFAGIAAYSNDATAFAAGDVYWGEENQDFPNPPLSGYAEANSTSNFVAELRDDEQGFLLFRVTTTNGFYIVKRAVFQNFDAWPADQRYFERSLGLYSIQTFTNMLTAGSWPAHLITADDFRYEDFRDDENVEDSDYLNWHVTSPKRWVFEQGRRILERAAPVGVPAVSEKNGAVMLDNRTAAGIWNSGFTMTYGVKEFSFKYRGGLQDNRICYYRNGFSWSQTLKIDATIRARSMAPSRAFISLVGFFYDAQNYYEARLVQNDDTRIGGWADNQLRIQFVRVVDGVATLLQEYNNGALGGKLTGSDERRIIFELTPNYPSAGQVRLSAMDGAVAASVWTNSYNDSLPGVLLQGGTAGFNANDAEIQVARVDIAVNGTPDPNASFTRFQAGLSDSEKNRWNTQTGRWTFTGSSSDGYLQRLLPLTSSFIVEATPYDPETSGTYGPNPNLWRPVGSPITISNLAAYVTHTVALERWNETFVRVRPYVAGDLDLVIDDTYIESWRGRTSDRTRIDTVAMDWTTPGSQSAWLAQLNSLIKSNDWALFEGWVADGGGAEGNGAVGNEIQLWRSRANPGLDQAFVSPLLTNGIGTISFLAWAGRATSRFEVQWSSDPDFVDWEILPSCGEFTLTPGLSPTNISVKVAQTNVQGRIRILHKANSHSNAVLYIDNVIVRDYPPEDNTTWKAYNCLIARPSSENGTLNLAFDGSSIRQSCHLNDSTTNNVMVPDVLDEAYPYVQTPEVDTGLGEISLFYRAWSATDPGRIIIRKAANQNVAEEAWLEVTNFMVTSETYQRLDLDYFDRTNKVLRLTVDRNLGRVAIDNMLLSEPVRAGFSVLRAWINPEIPLAGQAVDVYAEIGNFLMSPLGITMYVDYTTSSNKWGVQSWENAPGVGTIPMTLATGRVYKTTVKIDGLAADAVVQYVVRGRHSQLPEEKSEHVYQNSYQPPSWYYPVDLNARYQAQGWSPYYFVFSCSTGTVWINEINAYDANGAGKAPQYIEICGPSSVSLSGWQLIEERRPAHTVPYSTNQIINLGVSFGYVTNGIGFLLIGANDPVLSMRDITLTTSIANTAGGLRLVRSMGAFEECLTYDTRAAPGFGGLAMAVGDPHHRYVFAGIDDDTRTGSLGRDGSGNKASDFSWIYMRAVSSADWTLKLPNLGQDIIQSVIETLFRVISVIGGHGAQNGNAGPLTTSVQIAQGGSTSIVYTADQWYRIASFATNGIANTAAVGTNSYTWTVANLQGDQSNNVAFAEWAHPYSGVPLSWLDNWSEAQIAAGDGDSIPINTEYLLNTDPTANNSYNLKVNSITVVVDNVNVVVALTRSSSLGNINGTLRLYGRNSLTSGSWTLIGSTDVNGTTFGAEGNTHTYPFTDTGTTRFYRAVIE